MSDDRPHTLRAAAGAALAYLIVGLWIFGAVVPSPTSILPLPAAVFPHDVGVARSDQDFQIFVVSRNAYRFLSAPSELFEAGQCYPMPQALTLGEHMFGAGLLGAPILAASGDPILTLNGVVLLTYWLGAMAAYALVFRWTGDAGAAFVAGLLYAFHPLRTEDPMHPNIVGNQWTIFALFFADRLFDRRRWSDAVGLGVCLSLQFLESFYTVLGMVLIGGVYGLRLALVQRRALPAVTVQVAAAVALAVAVAWAVYAPYLETRATWGALGNRSALLYFPAQLAPGGRAYPGTVLLLLGAVALADRLRRRAGLLGRLGPIRDARLALALTAALLFWTIVYAVPLPFVDASVPSLWTLAAPFVPGMDAVRSGASVRVGLYAVLALLAGYGVAALGAGRSRAVRAGLVAAVTALWSIETLVPAVATRSYGHPVDLVGREARPPQTTVLLYGRVAEGAVLDLPLGETGSIGGNLSQASDYLLLHAFHRQPVGACNNSFLSEVPLQILGMARMLPQRAWKLDAFAALGFRYVVAHPDQVAAEQRGSFLLSLALLERPRPGHAHLVPIGRDGERRLYAIEGSPAAHSNLASLVIEGEAAAPMVRGPTASLVLRVRNPSPEAFVHPRPLAPTEFVVTWHSAAGALVAEERVRLLLPLALAGNDRQLAPLEAPVPPARGEMRVAVALAERPGEVLARWTVRVEGE